MKSYNKGLFVGLGELLWDLLPAGKQIGGAPTNFAYHASQFGFESCSMSALGDDELGREIIEILDQRELQRVIPIVDYPTGQVVVTLSGDGIPSYEIMESVAWDNIPFTPEMESVAKRCCCLCFGSLAQRNEVSRETIYRFLDSMPVEGTLRVFDINLRQHYYNREVIEESIKRSNALKINDDELVIVAKLFGLTCDDQRSCAEQMRQLFGVEILILTCGTDGSYIFTAEETSFLPTPKVEVVDTVGAGDSFTAAFCASLIKGSTIAEAHKKAVEISAFVCTQAGAMPTYDRNN